MGTNPGIECGTPRGGFDYYSSFDTPLDASRGSCITPRSARPLSGSRLDLSADWSGPQQIRTRVIKHPQRTIYMTIHQSIPLTAHSILVSRQISVQFWLLSSKLRDVRVDFPAGRYVKLSLEFSQKAL